MRAIGSGGTITCANCAGKGHVFTTSFDEMKGPIVCRGCNGSGLQTVRS